MANNVSGVSLSLRSGEFSFMLRSKERKIEEIFFFFFSSRNNKKRTQEKKKKKKSKPSTNTFAASEPTSSKREIKKETFVSKFSCVGCVHGCWQQQMGLKSLCVVFSSCCLLLNDLKKDHVWGRGKGGVLRIKHSFVLSFVQLQSNETNTWIRWHACTSEPSIHFRQGYFVENALLFVFFFFLPLRYYFNFNRT